LLSVARMQDHARSSLRHKRRDNGTAEARSAECSTACSSTARCS
jgi:hypothetical protein